MKKLKKVLLLIVVFLIVIALSLLIYLQTTKPQYEGQVDIKNISKNTEVFFDDYGIPHIYAANQTDAQVVLGYVHAQDRLWQMELLRRIAAGRLSELFGNKVSKTDMFFVGLGIDENSEKAVANINKDSESYKLATAYLDGINQYIVNGKTPVEYTLLGLEKKPFTLKDVYNIFGFMSFSFAMAQKTDPLMTDIRDNLGTAYLKDFGLDGSFGAVQLKSFEGEVSNYSEISKQVASILDNSPVPAFIGSNSWVIGSQKTKNGKVIFANDPHIAFAQPCTWYEAHISCPDYEIYGYYLAGTPFPLLAHNRNYAYGLTMFENDDIDLFQEEINLKSDSQYKYKNQYLNFKIRKKTIRVKDSSDIVLNIRESIHGPIMNGVMNTISTDKPIALSWIYTQEKNQILDAVYHLSHAKNITDFRNNIELIHAPGLNIMYGDAQNNISWTAAGKLYKLPNNVNPNFILNGSNGEDDKKEFLDFTKNPTALNPSWNYVYSSNNQTEAVDGYLYPGYYLPKDRAMRIESFLFPKNNWTSKDVEKMILDNTSTNAAKNAIAIVSSLNTNDFSRLEKDAMYSLVKWNGENELTTIQSTIYNKLIYRYLENTFQDELGKDKFSALLTTHVIKQMIEPQLANENSVWWDNSKTKDKKETQKEILTKSFRETVAELENQLGKDISKWTWNKVHTLEHIHPIGKIELLAPFFNVGKFEVAGSNEVINNLMFGFPSNGIYEVKAGPSTRRIIDFSDVENSVSILPTGNSGNPMSKHYNDQAEMYNQGKFRKMKMNKKEIIASSTKLVFILKK
ncbi:penicillin acylase family protein [Flavobacterium sp.]|uniref:penicillin acylase family protein n=1 Tax=Flavobacterium sp. TaxID=239 RepID=UPI002604AE8A|nr:penicillin acylase family protein [Flavobacterium sp.]